jgi:hypothetical protein
LVYPKLLLTGDSNLSKVLVRILVEVMCYSVHPQKGRSSLAKGWNSQSISQSLLPTEKNCFLLRGKVFPCLPSKDSRVCCSYVGSTGSSLLSKIIGRSPVGQEGCAGCTGAICRKVLGVGSSDPSIEIASASCSRNAEFRVGIAFTSVHYV